MKYNPSIEALDNQQWRSTDEDPWFLLEGPFPPGEYWLEFQARLISDAPRSNMKLYVGDKSGEFAETNCVVLGRLPDGTEAKQIKMRLRLHRTVSVFRFDPLQAAGIFELGPITITPRKTWLTNFQPLGEDESPTKSEGISAAKNSGEEQPQWLATRSLHQLARTVIHWALDWRRINEIEIGKPEVERDHGHDGLPTPPKVTLKEGQQPATLQYDLPWITPLNVEVRSDWAPRLNVFIPGIAMRAMSGGPNTVINLTYRLAREGVPIRYVSTDIPAESNQDLLFAHFAKLTGIPRLDHVEIVSAADRGQPLMLGARDVFFGSSWWTVQLIQGVLPRMRSPRFLYMIQDYEPGFLPWSSSNALAEETYGFDFRAVICGQLLADYLQSTGTGRFADPEFIHSCATFEPAVDRTRFYFDRAAHHVDRKRLLFYARPTAPRNMYEMGLYALRKAVEEGCFRGQEWELWGMGEPFPVAELARGIFLKPWPWSNYDDYARLLRSADVGLSLMQSPHTSYPPLEMAACGAQVVTNRFAVKTEARLLDYSSNIISVQSSVADMIRGLKEAEQRIGNWDQREQGSRLKLASDWDAVFEPMLPRVKAMWEECRQMAEEPIRVRAKSLPEQLRAA